MAKKRKKKTKKKAKKKAKKKVKRKRRITVDPYTYLLQKIDRIKERVPNIEPTGECRDPETNEVLFRFTEAQHVFNVYREECVKERLHFRPYMDATIRPHAIAVGNMPLLMGPFCIEDLETGARIIGWGSGMGRNGDWSGNTANTRALKQFLLTTFEANWEDPEQKKQNELVRMLDEVPIDQLKGMIERAVAQQEMDDFYKANIGKDRKNGRGRKRTRKKRNPSG